MSEEATQENAQAPQPTTAEPGQLASIIEKGRLARDESQKARAQELMAEFVDQALAAPPSNQVDVAKLINDRIKNIDQVLGDQLNEVLHAEPFQRLEASWRGLHMLVQQTETGTNLKLRVLNVTKKELLDDLERAPEFDQSALFKKVYEEEYGTFGGQPFGVLIGDYEFSRSPQDMALLEKISHVAAAAHAPFISAASASLFDMDSFTELSAPRDLAQLFQSTELVKWRSFREWEDSRYVALVLPHMLLRLPYGRDTVPVEGFNYDGGRRRPRPPQVPVGQRGVRDGPAHHQRLRAPRLVRRHPRRRGRRHRRGLARPHLPHRRGRHRAEVPHRDRHHRPAREGAERSRLHGALPLQGHRLRGLLRRADGQQAPPL